MSLAEQRGSSGSWGRERKDLCGLRQWWHIHESCLIEIKVCLLGDKNQDYRVLLYYLEANLQTFHLEFMEHIEWMLWQ